MAEREEWINVELVVEVQNKFCQEKVFNVVSIEVVIVKWNASIVLLVKCTDVEEDVNKE